MKRSEVVELIKETVRRIAPVQRLSCMVRKHGVMPVPTAISIFLFWLTVIQ